jgi:hypothetical protein
MMSPLVGDQMIAHDYLIGFEYIYDVFDWIMMYTKHTLLSD